MKTKIPKTDLNRKIEDCSWFYFCFVIVFVLHNGNILRKKKDRKILFI